MTDVVQQDRGASAHVGTQGLIDGTISSEATLTIALKNLLKCTPAAVVGQRRFHARCDPGVNYASGLLLWHRRCRCTRRAVDDISNLGVHGDVCHASGKNDYIPVMFGEVKSKSVQKLQMILAWGGLYWNPDIKKKTRSHCAWVIFYEFGSVKPSESPEEVQIT